MSIYQARHYEHVAETLRQLRPHQGIKARSPALDAEWTRTVRVFCHRFETDNPAFDGERFVKACERRL